MQRSDVRGLTTAASIWVTAAVGAACGADLIGPALLTVGFYLMATVPIRALETRISRQDQRSV